VAASADVVVLSHSLFSSKLFPSDGEPWPLELFDVLGRRWSRVILDEAHELAGLSREVQRRILALRSDAVHVLSGTPEGGGARGAASLALLFKASFASPCGFDKGASANAAAQEFFKTTARTQRSPFNLPVEEHVVTVQMTEAEKVLYTHFVDKTAGNTRELLELCCCFVKGESKSAKQEIGVLIHKKRRELQTRMAAAKGHTAFLLLLAQCLHERPKLLAKRQALKCRVDRKDFWEEGRRVVDGFVEELKSAGYRELLGLVKDEHVHGAKSRALFGVSEQSSEAAGAKFFLENLARVLTPPLLQQLPAVLDVFAEQTEQHLAQYYLALGSVKKPLDFLEHSMKELAEGGCCPLCLDELANGEATCMTSCGHAFHEDCLRDLSRVRSECPNCRQPIAEIYATKPAVPVDPWLKYGSKVKEMIRTLKVIMTEYPGERLLLFVQYRDIRKKLAEAFKEFQVPFLTLSGSARCQGAAITRWQSGCDPGDFLMMLSCEEHNSGITLTRARHWERDESG